jgi:integrase
MARKPYYLVKRRDRLTAGKATYYCRFRDEANGELEAWESTRETSETAADLWARAKQVERRHIRDAALSPVADVNTTLETFARGFFDWKTSKWIQRQHAKERRFSEPVARQRQAHVDTYIIPKFGKLRIADLDQKSIEDWLASLPLRAQTKNHLMFSFRIVLREAKLAGIIKTNVLADAEPFGGKPSVRGTLTLEELYRLFPTDGKKLLRIWTALDKATAFLLLWTTGLRSGELRCLRWLNVLPQGALLVDSGLDAFNRPKGTKTDTARVVLLPKRAREALVAWRKAATWCEPDDFIFSLKKGQPHDRQWLSRHLPGALERAKIDTAGRCLVPHSLRHQYVTAIANALDRDQTKALSGHSTDEALAIYRHPTAADLLAKLEPAREALEAAFSREAKS